MDLITRIKNILVSPKTEWQTIDGENDKNVAVLTKYVLLLAAIPALAAFIGYGVIGYSVYGHHFASVNWGVKQAIIQYITMVGGVYITALVINLLAENFGSKKSFDKAFSLVAYAYTPAFVGGIFYIYHSLSILASLASIYSLYLLYVGLAPIMKTPDDKRNSYFVVSLLVMVGAFIVLGIILASIFIGSAYGAYRF